MFQRCFCLLITLAGAGELMAQTEPTAEEVFAWQFAFAAPDTSFRPLELDAGWQEPATDTKVIAMAAPFPFARMAKDLDALESAEGQRIVERKTLQLGGVDGLLLLIEFEPIEADDPEPTYSLMFARPFDGMSLVLNALYPKSQHDRLYPKMLAAFATVRKTNP